ncbi:unnamed protein product [Rhizoctonia solani]|uniref:Mitochondrial import inner membrane translocase subunit TIM22 n=1 Tax=Rhizoctonia solani TaxID=456999 RepID=A0A8H3B4V9_9AGAM|nr:unnamed protein product [Rhizoctonia solani]
MADHSRDPCPYVILNEAGAGFVTGAIGGGIWHGIKGARHAPKVIVIFCHLVPENKRLDQGSRLEGAAYALKARSPAVAGNFAAWTGLLSAFNCAITGYRQKNDIWNGVFSGAGTGGCLSARGWTP